MNLTINKEWKYEESFKTISAYTTTYNCIQGGYPFEEAIKSFLWADECCVVDGGSTDGTREQLVELAKQHSNLKIYDMPIDLSNPGSDGAQKSISRAMCFSEFCLPFDADEICPESSALKFKKLAKEMPSNVNMLNLPVYEPVGQKENIRLGQSFNIWKWRLSRNLPEISHGIPDGDREEVDGKIYSKGGSDGCFPINVVDNKLIQGSFPDNWFTNDLYKLRDTNVEEYKNRLEEIFEKLPFVYHVGHVDLENKIKLYLSSWHKMWCGLFNKNPNDPENNKFFPGVRVEDVTQEMIDDKVEELKKEGSLKIESAVNKLNV